MYNLKTGGSDSHNESLHTTLNELDRFQLLPKYLEKLKDNIPEIPILLIGTKYELEAKISKNDIFELIQSHKSQIFDYIEVSSKTGENVGKVMEILLGKILNIPISSDGK
ncbi:MAG: hypothetical protein ACTSVL_06755 [Promethearchaeota archaeon]